MRISDIVGMCLKNLWRRKIRTLLTVLGVVIGSCAIVVMISLGIGSNKSLEYSLSQMGDLNVITIYGGSGGMVVVEKGGGDSKNTSQPPALNKDTLTVIQQIDGVTGVFPKLRLDSDMFSLYAGKNNKYKGNWMDIYGVYPEYLEKFGFEIEKGSVPEEPTNNFIIFGSQAAYQFRDTKKRQNEMTWPEQMPDGTVKPPFFEPMDEQILLTVNNSKKPIENDNYGGYQSGGKGYEFKLKTAAVLKEDFNKYESVNAVMLDMSFAEKLIADYNRLNGIKDKKETVYSELGVYVENLDDVSKVQDVIDEMGLQSFSMDTIREQMQGQVIKQQMLLGGLAAISLFVAAIGITNTMIMSIYERTREIGVMKVLGCFIKNIRQVFLLEAGCIGLLGGIMGSIISFIISAILNAVGGGAIGSDMMYMGEEPVKLAVSIIPPWLVLLALAFSTFVGLVSGFYPANRAVKISALEAIKNE